MAEVRRLEDMRYQQMVDLVLAKGAELTALCKDSHVAEPAGLQEALIAIHSNDRNPGAAAELLAKLLQMLAEMQVRSHVWQQQAPPLVRSCVVSRQQDACVTPGLSARCCRRRC